MKEQHRLLSLKLRGHFNYYGLTGNRQALANFQRQVSRIWRKWLSRRHRSRLMRWEHFQRLMERYPLPPPRVVHSVYARAANS